MDEAGHDLSAGLGMATGYATIGAIGFEGRWDYGVIGTVTNLAARMCAEAQPGQILISQRFLNRVEDLVQAELLGEVALKGFNRTISTFNILRLS
jgi:class 3 adenylate cyclase